MIFPPLLPTPAPRPPRADPLVETRHGLTVADPFRWLEADDAEEVLAFEIEERRYARAALEALPGRAVLSERIRGFLTLPHLGVPRRRGRNWFRTVRTAEAEQVALHVADRPEETGRLLLDPAADGDSTRALDWWFPSPDGRLVAVGLSRGGSEQSELHVIRVADGAFLPDVIPDTRSAHLAWRPDGSGFYYTRRPAPTSGQTWFNRVFLHPLGGRPQDDRLVFGAASPDEAIHSPHLSPDGKWLVISVQRGSAGDENTLWLGPACGGLKRLETPTGVACLPIALDDRLLVLTNLDAPRWRLIALDWRAAALADAVELIPETEDTLETVVPFAHGLLCLWLRDAAARLTLHDASGRLRGEVPLPEPGTIDDLAARVDDEAVLFSFTSFLRPQEHWRVGADATSPTRLFQQDAPGDWSRFVVERRFARSADGTRVPLFLVRGRDRAPGPGPALLSGYGGFDVSMTPAFVGHLTPFLEDGGLYALAVLRGGGEYGEQWHRAATGTTKQRTFDDFLAAARLLVDEGLTRPAQLAIRGGSNGGLLVGAALTQHPELFGAVVCQVPLADMVRYHHFLIARLWVPEYGSAEDPDGFRALLAYSPYHQVREGTRYPPILLTAARGDSRVAPLHARKLAARLRAAHPDNVVLLDVEPAAGHGQGKPLGQRLASATDVVSFVMSALGMTAGG